MKQVELIALINSATEKTLTPSEYQDILLLLSSATEEDYANISKECDLVKMFLKIDLSHPDLSRIALKLAVVIFAKVDFAEFVTDHEPEVMLALSSDHTELVSFILDKMITATNASDLSTELLCVVIQGVLNEKLAISKVSGRFIVEYCKIPGHVTTILETPVLFNPLASCETTHIRLRVLDLLIDICSLGRVHAEKVIASGIFSRILTDIQSSDLLSQANYLEILKRMVVLDACYQFLLDNGIIDTVLTATISLMTDPFAELLFPQYLSFLAVLLHKLSQPWLGNNRVIQILSSGLHSETLKCRNSTLHAIAHVATNRQNIVPISQLFESHLTDYLSTVGHGIQGGSDENVLCCLDCITCLMSRSDVALDSEVEDSTTLSWLNKMDQSVGTDGAVINRVLAIAREPFADRRYAAYQTIMALSTQTWAVQMFTNVVGLMDFLLNRKTEDVFSDEKGKFLDVKFAIIGNLVESNTHIKARSNAFCSEALLRLRGYLKEGVWGVRQAESTVAMEDA